MSRIFKDVNAKKKFSESYHRLPADKQEQFGAAIRKLADEKITRLDLVDDFYVDEMDVLTEYNKLIV